MSRKTRKIHLKDDNKRSITVDTIYRYSTRKNEYVVPMQSIDISVTNYETRCTTGSIVPTTVDFNVNDNDTPIGCIETHERKQTTTKDKNSTKKKITIQLVKQNSSRLS